MIEKILEEINILKIEILEEEKELDKLLDKELTPES